MKKGAFKIQTGKITLTNGRIYTPDGLVNNLVFGHGRIIAAGGNEIIDRDSKKIDLHGRTVLPGFCDCNLNFIEWACANEIINLSACGNFNDVPLVLFCKRISAFIERISEFAVLIQRIAQNRPQRNERE